MHQSSQIDRSLSRVPGRRFLGVVAALALALIAALPARAQTLYTAGGGAQFGTINVATGTFSPIGTGFSTYGGSNVVLAGVAYATNGNLYGMDYMARLFQINRSSGVLSLIGTVSGFTNTTQDLSIGNTADGTIYMFYAGSTTTGPSIYRIDPTTAAATLLGASGSTYFDGGIGGDGSGNLYTTGGNGGSQTFKLSLASGAATQLTANSGAGASYALGYTSSHLYALGSAGGIYTLNLTTGAAIDTGVAYNTTTAGVSQGVAPLVFTPVPEPSTCATLGLGAVGLLVLTLRQRQRICRA